MRSYTRRQVLLIAGSGAAMFCAAPGRASDAQHFAAEAARMRRQAIAAGDQPYGAVVVLNGNIIGFGPSRVVTDRDVNAHAERVALWNAQSRLGRREIDGAVIYATSQPCSICQKALAQAGIVRIYVGPAATDAGSPEP